MKPVRVASLSAIAVLFGGLLTWYLFERYRGGDHVDAVSLHPDINKQLEQSVNLLPPASRKSTHREMPAAANQNESTPAIAPGERLFDCSFEDLQKSNERRGAVPPFYFTGNDEQITQAMHRVARDLEVAADSELLVLAAYLRTRLAAGGEWRADELERTAQSTNPLVAWTWLAICEHSQLERCIDGSALQHAIAVDGGNGVVLERLASQAFRNGEHEKAFATLEQALAAPRFNTYFAAQVAMFDRALAAVSNADYQARMAAAFGFAAGMGRATETFKACTDETLSSAYWHTCRQYGERLETSSDNILDQLIGLSMQENVYRLQGSQRELETVAERKDAISSGLNQFTRSDVRLVMNSDAAVMRQYMEHFSTYGELAAIRFVDSEVRRLAQDPSYDPCASLHGTDDELLQDPEGL